MHPLRECPLDNVNICPICAYNHDTKNCPSFSRLQALYQGSNGKDEPTFQDEKIRPWKPHPQGMTQYHSLQFYASYNSYPQQWNDPMPWKPTQNQPWRKR